MTVSYTVSMSENRTASLSCEASGSGVEGDSRFGQLLFNASKFKINTNHIKMHFHDTRHVVHCCDCGTAFPHIFCLLQGSENCRAAFCPVSDITVVISVQTFVKTDWSPHYPCRLNILYRGCE